jgi:uncharacterized protein YigA (DUF484 family)
MTRKAGVGPASVATDDTSVVEYLEAFPDFFVRHPQLLQRIRLPDARNGGTTVSLLERQVEVLRERNRHLDRRLSEFIEIAHSNDELATKIHRLTTRLVHARSLERVVDAIEASLREDFDVQRAVLVLFREEPVLAARDSRFVRLVKRDAQDIRGFEALFSSGRPRCGQVRDSQRDFLFGAAGSGIGSVALTPIGPGGSIGLLACGAASAHRFNPTMSTDFLARIGELIAAAVAAE